MTRVSLIQTWFNAWGNYFGDRILLGDFIASSFEIYGLEPQFSESEEWKSV